METDLNVLAFEFTDHEDEERSDRADDSSSSHPHHHHDHNRGARRVHRHDDLPRAA